MRVNPRDFRDIEKSKAPVQVQCSLTDCVFHEGATPGMKNGDCLCSHPHKRQYLIGTCPLYRLDWMKQMKR